MLSAGPLHLAVSKFDIPLLIKCFVGGPFLSRVFGMGVGSRRSFVGFGVFLFAFSAFACLVFRIIIVTHWSSVSA